MNIGAHVSIAGGVFEAPARAAGIGCEVLQMFSRSPQGGPAPVLTRQVAERFLRSMKEHHQARAYIHAPYFVNFSSSVPRIAHGSVSIVRTELGRASLLSCTAVVTHLGSAAGTSREAGIAQIIRLLKETLKGYKGTARLFIENSAGSGAVLGDSFEELHKIVDGVHSDKLGVCIDLAHAFASGYELRTPKGVNDTARHFDRTVGLQHLELIHANDSKVSLGERKDRHEHVGQGQIGTAGFRAIVAHPAFRKLDFILETEPDGVEEDIGLLKTFRDDMMKKKKTR